MKTSALYTILVFIIIFFGGISASYYLLKPKKILKIYKPSDLNPKLVDESLLNNSSQHTIAPFSLINQNGKITTEKDLANKIYVADFFFTTCPSICPSMSKQMLRIFNQYKEQANVMLVSHTVMPEVDSVPVLMDYAQRYGINSDDKWLFLTGDKKEIYKLARKSYFAAINEGNGDKDDFIHTENFVLIDTKKQIRGFYDGTSKEEVDRLIDDIEILLQEH
jgi:protein SCO1/2